MRTASRPILVSALLAAAPTQQSDLAAQARPADEAGHRLEQLGPVPLGAAGLLGVNVLLGAVSTGILRELRGGSFLEGLGGGALAGGLVYAGKAVAAQRFSGAGLTGRQLAAVGTSVAGNVAAGAPPFSRLELPIGPARLVLDHRGSHHVGIRVDPVGFAVLAYAVLEPRLTLDASASLSAGTPVFRGDEPLLVVPVSRARAVGLELGSVVMLADLTAYDATTRADVFAHERVHTVQADAFQAFFGRALLEWLAPDGPGWRRAVDLIDLNLGEAAAELAVGLFARRGIWEMEAEHIGR